MAVKVSNPIALRELLSPAIKIAFKKGIIRSNIYGDSGLGLYAFINALISKIETIKENVDESSIKLSNLIKEFQDITYPYNGSLDQKRNALIKFLKDPDFVSENWYDIIELTEWGFWQEVGGSPMIRIDRKLAEKLVRELKKYLQFAPAHFCDELAEFFKL